MKTVIIVASCILVVGTTRGAAQSLPPRPPVIDMHVHSTTTSPALLAQMDSLNLRYFVLSGLALQLPQWASADTTHFLSSLIFPCGGGRAPVTGQPCFDHSGEFPDTVWLRAEIEARRIRGFGELLPQFLGMSPSDARLAPYWRLAEEFDLPVGIHLGSGPPAAAYESSPAPHKSPDYRAMAGDPLLLEEVLLRHKGLRVFIMHAGWPRLESTLALLYSHPNVYVDVAALQTPFVLPRAGYYSYLQALVNAGFAKRIMFGSDFPAHFRAGVDAILEADFLTPEQKSDILCGNAARFLRMDPVVCR